MSDVTTPGLVSVLMPVLNESASIRQAIEGALRQTHPDVELLVIDGRSTDDTRAIVEAMAEHDPRIRILDNPDRNIPSALNVGLAAAKGEYVGRIDAHATVNDEYVAIGVAHLQANPRLAAVGGRRTTVAQTPTGRAIGMALSSPFGVGDSLNHYSTEAQLTDHASFGVYRASAAREVGGWDTSLFANEDVDFDFRLMGCGYEIMYDPAMVIRWKVRETIRDLGHQYRRYGRGKGGMVRKNGPGAIRPRHLAPVALLGNLGLAGAALAARRPLWAAGLLAPYAGVISLATVQMSRSSTAPEGDVEVPGQPEPRRLALPAALVTMHASWGLGFIEGVAGSRPALSSQKL